MPLHLKRARPLLQTMTCMPRHLTRRLARNWPHSGIALSAWLCLGLASLGHAAVDVIAEYRLGASTPQITYTSGLESMPDSAGHHHAPPWTPPSDCRRRPPLRCRPPARTSVTSGRRTGPISLVRPPRATPLRPRRCGISGVRKRGDQLALEITIPANTTATVFVPASDVASVTESGKAASASEGVMFLRMKNNAAIYAVGSGTYRFQSTLPKASK